MMKKRIEKLQKELETTQAEYDEAVAAGNVQRAADLAEKLETIEAAVAGLRIYDLF